ncbi:MAG: hypothetical protein ACE5FM_07920, partial [Methyloligellaceae bacterium]
MPDIMMRCHTLLVTGVFALALGLLLGVTPARAICTPPAASGVTATCTGVTVNQNAPDGYGTSLNDNVTVNVLTGASVIGTNEGIATGDDLILTNNGFIRGIGSDGVDSSDDIRSLINFGTIIGADDGVDAQDDVNSLINHGVIIGVAGDGVDANDDELRSL